MNTSSGSRRSEHGPLRRCLYSGAMGLVVLGAVLCHQTASAGLVDQGLTTLDTASGEQWLDMSLSVGIPAQSIIDGTDPGHLHSQGWSLASISQITTLLLDGGMTQPFDGVLSPGNHDAAAFIVALLGKTGTSGPPGSAPTVDFIQAFSSEGPSAGVLYNPNVLVSLAACPNCFGGASVPGTLTPAVVANPTIGNWLVRSAAVPEPGTLLLLGGGVAWLAFTRRREG